MRTRRSWRNQDRLFRAISKDLQEAAKEVQHDDGLVCLAEGCCHGRKNPPRRCRFCGCHDGVRS